jgi:hypothetical protein
LKISILNLCFNNKWLFIMIVSLMKEYKNTHQSGL